MAKDNLGNELTREQELYFKNSKVRDKQGNLIVCYHGSPNSNISEFNPSMNKSQFGRYKFNKTNVNYFTTDKKSAISYTELGVEREGNLYSCYLNIVNPFIVDNKSLSDIKSSFNIKDERIRQKELDLFNRIFNKWEGKFIDYSDFRFKELNRDLGRLNYELRPSEEYGSDIKDDEIEYFDLWYLGKNSMFGDERIVERSYSIDELFSDDMYDELKETIIGIDEDDYYFSTDDIVRYVLVMNEEDGTNYDGIIISDIIDSKDMFSDITTDYITLKSSNQIKRISNLSPTSSNNINESIQEVDNEGNILSKEQVKFFKNSKVRNNKGNLLVCYHNSNEEFATFDKGKVGSNAGGSFGKGFYFSTDGDIASNYGNIQRKFYLNIINPFDYYTTNVDKIKNLIIKSNVKYNKEALDNLEEDDLWEEDLLDTTLDKILLDNPYNVFSDMVKSCGYDGIICGEEIIAFESNQIKLVSNDNPTDEDNINESLNEESKLEMSNEYDSEGHQLTKAQAEFFKDSKVRDDKGRLIVCYHGTDKDFNVFDKSKISKREDRIKGFYFSTEKRKGVMSSHHANRYGGKMLKCYLNITNPYIDCRPYEFDCDLEGVTDDNDGVIAIFGKEQIDKWRDNGYEYTQQINKGDIIEIIAFEPNQIKSIDNKNPSYSSNINESVKSGIELYHGSQDKDLKIRDDYPLYLTNDLDMAKDFALGYNFNYDLLDNDYPTVYKIKINIKNPYVITTEEEYEDIMDITEYNVTKPRLEKEGYDSIIYIDEEDNINYYLLFDAKNQAEIVDKITLYESLNEKLFGKGIDINDYKDKYIKEHFNELLDSLIDTELSLDKEDLIYKYDIEENASDEEIERIVKETIKEMSDWELEDIFYDMLDDDEIEKEIKIEFENKYDELIEYIEKLKDKYNFDYEEIYSKSWSTGIIQSRYVIIKKNDEEVYKIRFSDGHDNGRNDEDIDIDFREFDSRDMKEIESEIDDRLDESLKESNQPSKEEVLQELDDVFGQSEPYLWSTYILPNGHCLNPDNGEDYWEDVDLEPEYEHSDFYDYKYNPYGQELFDDTCVKINVNDPYISLPNKVTSKQWNMIETILTAFKNGEEKSINQLVDEYCDNAKNMTTPFIFFTNNYQEVVDLDKYDIYDLIKKLKKSLISGVLDLDESLNEDIDENSTHKTGKAYKVFRIKNGKLYPPMVANKDNKDTPIGKWIEAEEGEFAGLSKTGRPQVKQIKGGQTLSYRPGWHLGEIPRASQFDRTNKETGEVEFPKDFVWAECDYIMDIDYQKQSDEQGYMRTKKDEEGNVITTRSDKYQHSLAGLPYLPKNGYYKYRTNPNPNTVPWIITGAIKVNKLLSDEEVNDLLKKNGVKPIHRQGGDKTLKELGLQDSLQEKIVKKGNKWQVQSEKGRNMGTYDTKEEAEKRLKQIEYFKHINESLKLDEATRNQLINKTKNSDNYKDTSKGKNRYERRTRSRIANSVSQYNKINMDEFFKKDILNIGVDVNGETDNYVVTIRLKGVLKALQSEVKRNNNKLEFKNLYKAISDTFANGDIQIHCTCPDSKYRQNFWQWKNGDGTQYEPRPSDKTNPFDTKGAGCKHTMLVLSNKDWVMKVASVLNNYIKYSQQNLQNNYANYIFPKIYGIPYTNPVQMRIDDTGLLPSDQKTIQNIASTNLKDKDEKGRWTKGNKFRFTKDKEDSNEKENPNQLKFQLDKEDKK